MTERARYAFLHEIGVCVYSGRIGDIHVAHIRFSDAAWGKVNPGMARKPHWVWTVPLAPDMHALQHKIGERKFWDGRRPLETALILEGFRALGDADAARAWLLRQL